MAEISFKIHDDVKFECASLITGWYEDAGNLGYGVLTYLKNKIRCRLLAEVEPAGYWPMNNIMIADDVARFPESKLYYCPDKSLLLFMSHSPGADWYRFLNTVLDMAGYHCRLQQIYTMGGIITLNRHTADRHISMVVSSPAMKASFAGSDIKTDMDYETPEGQRPTLSTFLMWTARQRDIPAVSLWGQVPFYLAGLDDPRSWRPILTFLNDYLSIGLDLTDLDTQIKAQDDKFTLARDSNPELDDLFKRLESGQTLSPEENDQLVGDLEDIFKTDE